MSQKISELASGAPLVSADTVVMARGAGNVKGTLSDVSNFVITQLPTQGTLQNAYDASVQPQVTTTNPLQGVQFQRGSNSDTQAVLEVLDGAGVETFIVRGNGRTTIGQPATLDTSELEVSGENTELTITGIEASLSDDDKICTINFRGSESEITNNTAEIQIRTPATGGSWNASESPSNMIFSVTPKNSLVLSELMRLVSEGNLLVGTTTDTGERLQVNGAIKATSYVGLPNNTLFISNADAVVVNTITETTLVASGAGTVTIPAANLKANAKFKIKIQGIISDTGNPTFQLRATLGGTLIGDTGANSLGAVLNDHWFLEIEFVVRTEGVSGTIMASGAFLTEQGDHFGMANTAAIVINTTVAQTLDVTAEWGVASASNTVTAQIFELEEFNV